MKEFLNLFSFKFKRMPLLPTHVQQAFSQLEPNNQNYYPCTVVMQNGGIHKRVLLAEYDEWSRLWGTDITPYGSKRFINVVDIASLQPCIETLPITLINQLYNAGESCMGGCLYKVVFKDGTSLDMQSGNVVDFIQYPKNQSQQTVEKVIPHYGSVKNNQTVTPEFMWGLYQLN